MTKCYRVNPGINEVGWLGETQGPPNPNFIDKPTGWALLSGYVFMSEDVYLMYCLKFGHEQWG